MHHALTPAVSRAGSHFHAPSPFPRRQDKATHIPQASFRASSHAPVNPQSNPGETSHPWCTGAHWGGGLHSASECTEDRHGSFAGLSGRVDASLERFPLQHWVTPEEPPGFGFFAHSLLRLFLEMEIMQDLRGFEEQVSEHMKLRQ